MIFGDGIDGKCFWEPEVADAFGRHFSEGNTNFAAVDSSFCCDRYFADSSTFAYLAAHKPTGCMKATDLGRSAFHLPSPCLFQSYEGRSGRHSDRVAECRSGCRLLSALRQ